MKTLDEALSIFTKEEVVSFKWDKEINAETGEFPCKSPPTLPSPSPSKNSAVR